MGQCISKCEYFPNDPLFNRLTDLARAISGTRICDDHGIEASYVDLLNDIAHLRRTLRQQLPAQWFDDNGILLPETATIATLASSGYFFVVAFFCILSIGGSCVPLSLDPENVLHHMGKANATCLLAGPPTVELAYIIKEKAGSSMPLHIVLIERFPKPSWLYNRLAFKVDKNLIVQPERTGLIIFTSGTSGKPKGAAIPRSRFHVDLPMAHDSVYLACRPLYWIGGASRIVFQVLSGGKIHSTIGALAPAADIWKFLVDKNITKLSLSSQVFRKLQDHYLDVIQKLPSEEHEKYLEAVSKLDDLVVSGSPLTEYTAAFWERLTKRPIRNAYAATEFGGSAMITKPGAPYIQRHIGRPLPGVIIKLSNGDSGEILVKSPGMFTHYVGDEASTKEAFNDEGLYRSGDLGRLIDGQYFFEGRANADYIHFYQNICISVLELEERLQELPYISEAHILHVPDYEARGLAAALIRLRSSSGNLTIQDQKINLQKLRHDLLPNFGNCNKLPALLRILKDDEQVPMTASQKVLKKEALKRFFEIEGYRPLDYCVQGVEFWGNQMDGKSEI